MFDNWTQIEVEVKIGAIELIIDTIDDILKADLTVKKWEYLNKRRNINLKKLEACQNMIKTQEKGVRCG